MSENNTSDTRTDTVAGVDQSDKDRKIHPQVMQTPPI